MSCCNKPSTCCDPETVIATALEVSNSWNVPACGEVAVLYIPGLTTVLIGSYITNPTYGTFRVTGINSLGGKLSVTNDCLPDTVPAGTLVPADTTFVFTGPPTLTTYESWTPAFSASGAMTVAVNSLILADHFIIDSTVFFEIAATLTLGGVTSTSVYFTIPLDGVINFLAPDAWIETSAGVNKGGSWSIDSADASRIALALEGFGNWPLGAATVHIQARYQKA